MEVAIYFWSSNFMCLSVSTLHSSVIMKNQLLIPFSGCCLVVCLFVCSWSKTGSREPLLQSVPSSSFFVFIDAFHSKLRVNVGKYRESQISSKKSNFGLYHPNNRLGDLFQEMILRNPQVLYVLRNLEKFEKFHKNTFFIREIAAIFNNFQGSSTSAQKLLLTWCCTCSYQLPKAFRLHKSVSQNNFCNTVLGFHCLHLDCVLFRRSK